MPMLRELYKLTSSIPVPFFELYAEYGPHGKYNETDFNFDFSLLYSQASPKLWPISTICSLSQLQSIAAAIKTEDNLFDAFI